jgi:hypothetical protein
MIDEEAQHPDYGGDQYSEFIQMFHQGFTGCYKHAWDILQSTKSQWIG